MPQDPIHRPAVASPSSTQALPSGSQTERFALHVWILVIAAALLWALLS